MFLDHLPENRARARVTEQRLQPVEKQIVQVFPLLKSSGGWIIPWITHWIILWKFPSGVGGRKLPTSPEVFFLPPVPWDREPVDKFSLELRQLPKVGLLGPRILPGGADDAFVLVIGRAHV